MTDDQIPSAIVRGDAPSFAGTSGAALSPDVTVVPTYTLHSRGHVAGATFLGGPLAGAIVMAFNYKRLGQPSAARLAVILGVVATAVLLAVAFAIPQLPYAPLPIASVLAMSAIARSLQGAAFDSHLARGGKAASAWPVIGVGVGSLVLVAGAAIGVAFLVLTAALPAHELDLGRDHKVYYDDATGEAGARALGDLLTTSGYFGPHAAALAVTVADGRHVVSFIVQDRAFTDDEVQKAFREIATLVSTQVFHDEPVDIWLSDDSNKPHVKLRWQSAN